MAARHHGKAAVFFCHVIQQDQGGDDVAVGMGGVGEVLMVADFGLRAREFQIDLAVVKLHVGPDEIGHHIDRRRLAHHDLEGPGKCRRGLLTRRKAGRSGECSAPISKRGRPSRVGGPKGVLWARLCSTPEGNLPAHGGQFSSLYRIAAEQYATLSKFLFFIGAQHHCAAPKLSDTKPSG